MPSSSSPMVLPRTFLRTMRRASKRLKVADSIGTEMTGGTLLLRTLVLRRILQRDVLAADEKNVGVLLPPSAGAFLVNAALPLMQRVTVNLNYTVAENVMQNCIDQAGIRHVLTSRKFAEKLNLKLNTELVYLEDLKPLARLSDKVIAAVQAKLLPVSMLEKQLGLLTIKPDDLLTIVFTSGSTGEPKGVMLSDENLRSNVAAIEAVIRLTDQDVILGILPFFHSFGYMVTFWTVMTLGLAGVYHFNPLDAQQVSKLCAKYGVTMMVATPTFFRTYLKRCEPAELKTLQIAVGGAERFPKELIEAFAAKFGVRPVEGYGCTELSPLVAVNIPPGRGNQKLADDGLREGTVGRPVPNVQVRVVDLDSGAVLESGKAGMLQVKGPNVMQGYLNRPELTEKAIADGWYNTGDVAILHPDGFIQITGRESRFSKIGGEMVPHIKIEENLQQLLATGEDELTLVVTAVPDERKGERLVVLHTAIPIAPKELCKGLSERGLPNLWIPGTDSFFQVETIPILGTGKVDLKGVKDKALELTAG
ncbi:MAG: AMP-binding protein [Planctomycetota bacterium]|nr:AMP-binding protein [Planctomycetota bacterium]